MSGLRLHPVTLDGALEFVREHHRHAKTRPASWRFGVGVAIDDDLVGVGVAGNPPRELDDGMTICVVRVCTDGTPNACSMLYGALCRAARALGFRSAVTYTLESETGASLRASGFVPDATVPARDYGGGRARYETNLFGEPVRPPEAKVRWRRSLQPTEIHA